MESKFEREMIHRIDTFRNTIKDNTHFMFLFASPIINSFDKTAKESKIAQLNFSKEFDEIKSALEYCKTLLNYKSMVATLENLPDVLIRNPYVLHFSGHGVKNNFQSIGSEAVIRKNEGDMLVFENSSLCATLLSEMNLKHILDR